MARPIEPTKYVIVKSLKDDDIYPKNHQFRFNEEDKEIIKEFDFNNPDKYKKIGEYRTFHFQNIQKNIAPQWDDIEYIKNNIGRLIGSSPNIITRYEKIEVEKMVFPTPRRVWNKLKTFIQNRKKKKQSDSDKEFMKYILESKKEEQIRI